MSSSNNPKSGGGGKSGIGSRPRIRAMWSANLPSADTEAYLPSMDVYEQGGKLTIELELPGMKKDNIAVFVTGHVLTIEGIKGDIARAEGSRGERISYLQIERKFGRFQRSIKLPEHFDPSTPVARFRNGVLLITVDAQKKEPEEKRRVRIE